MKYIYGPILSRNLGNVLGVDIVPLKICNFDCVYCELGKTTNKTIKRQSFFDYKSIVKEVIYFFEHNKSRVDYILISGSGETTLNTDIGKIVRILKKNYKIPIALVTNGSFLNNRERREEISVFDTVFIELDAFNESKFYLINKPYKGILFDDFINGLIEFSNEFKGKIYLRVTFIKDKNDSSKDIIELRRIISNLNIDKLQINTITKQPAYSNIKPIDNNDKKRIKELLSDITNLDFYFKEDNVQNKNINKDDVVELLSKQTLTFEMISGILKVDMDTLRDIIKKLSDENRIIVKKLDNNFYYRIKDE